MMTVEMTVMKMDAVREYVCTCTHVNVLHMLLGTEKVTTPYTGRVLLYSRTKMLALSC